MSKAAGKQLGIAWIMGFAGVHACFVSRADDLNSCQPRTAARGVRRRGSEKENRIWERFPVPLPLLTAVPLRALPRLPPDSLSPSNFDKLGHPAA